MPKYLVQASYTSEGLKCLQQDKSLGHRTAVASTVQALGGKLERIYHTFGTDDVVAIVDMPDNVGMFALSLTVEATGFLRTTTTPLLTIEEADEALAKSRTH
jgi:uncharacterized protein with GYD domain